MKNEAINALIEMGIPADRKGFRYIVEIICMYDKDEKMLEMKLTDVYRIIGENHNAKDKSVEKAIRHAFGFAFTKGDIETLKKYISLQHKSNGVLLSTLYYRLKMLMENTDVHKFCHDCDRKVKVQGYGMDN